MFHVEQSEKIHVKNCPVCKGEHLEKFLDIKDYFLTGEEFGITECKKCGLLFTNPRPDEKELPKYYESVDYLSHSKEDRGVFSRLYNIIRAYSVRKKYGLITKYKKNGKLLDIGCGTGEVLNYFSKKGWEVKGIEPAESARTFARKNYGLSVSPEKEIDNLESDGFDVITLWHVLEHVTDPVKRMQQIYRLLKDDGILVIALPNHKAWEAEKFSSYWAAWDVPRHLFHFSKESFGFLARQNHFEVIKTLPMKFDSYYVSLLSLKYQSGKMNYPKAFYFGMRSNFSAKSNDNNYSSLIYILKKKKS
jgi:2-polyprenyl-3-methyl-5-hydroxy-6-metoxy-1,4-benzoquinol methylase